MKNENIPVVILAGGFGTRLREQTEFIPKPMVPIGGKPVLWHIMKIYSSYGFRRFIICLGYKGEIIKDYFYNYKMRTQDFTIHLSDEKGINYYNLHKEENWEVTLADTGVKAMTGARLKQVERYIDTETFLMTYGDGVSNARIDKTLDFHLSHHKAATVTGVKPPSRFGELIVDNDRVVEFSEKPQVGSGLINGGFFVFDRKVFEFLSADDSCMFEKEPMENLAKTGNLMVYQHDGFWQCMDTLRDMNLLNELWDRGKPPWQVWKD